MTATDLLVIAAGVAAIAWVNWYFLFSTSGAAQAVAGTEGVQETTIEVKGGYAPATVRVRTGSPVRLVFDRQETSGCSEEVVLPEWGVRRFLPAFQKTPVEFTPEKAGKYDFTCGMGMMRGNIIVEEDAS